MLSVLLIHFKLLGRSCEMCITPVRRAGVLLANLKEPALDALARSGAHDAGYTAVETFAMVGIKGTLQRAHKLGAVRGAAEAAVTSDDGCSSVAI